MQKKRMMMDRNVKIAKELVRVAKSLIALDEEGDGSGFQALHDMNNHGIKNQVNLADKPGKYENFTGIIHFMGNYGKVEDATFKLDELDTIIWHNGTWKDGTWNSGIWHGGTWKDGIWEDGTWKGGTWENGIWKKGTWYDGIWKDGAWYDGTWEAGYWENGTWEGGSWEDGSWYDGSWEGGYWEGGYDADEHYHAKDDRPDQW